VPDDAVGELQMRPRGGSAVVAYYKDPEASAAKTAGGWVSTGDWFRHDPDGNYWFVDRKRDVIRRRGINLAPAVIEDAVRQHPAIAEVAAFAVPDDLGEDEIKIVVLLDDGDDLAAADVALFADERLPRHMRPRYIEVVSDLPLTPGTQRVQRFKLRESWATPTTWDTLNGDFIGKGRA
jgi:crotonobetaine/carnitine-CoA ligase